MPMQEFDLNATGTQRVQVFWNNDGGRPVLTVFLNQDMLGSMTSQEELTSGKEFGLPDGSLLEIRFVGDQLQAFRNGQSLSSPTAVTSSPPGAIAVTSAPPAPAPVKKVRGGCLTTWLILIILGSAVAMYDSFTIYQDLEVHDGISFPHWIYLVQALLNLIIIVGVVALLAWRKWGLYLCLLCSVSALVLVFVLQLPVPFLQIFGGIISYSILFGLLKANDRWKQFRW